MQPAKVLISYSAPDRHVISQLAEDLETAGAEVWHVDRNLPPGKQISEVFLQIENPDFVLIGLSKASVPSRPKLTAHWRPCAPVGRSE